MRLQERAQQVGSACLGGSNRAVWRPFNASRAYNLLKSFHVEQAASDGTRHAAGRQLVPMLARPAERRHALPGAFVADQLIRPTGLLRGLRELLADAGEGRREAGGQEVEHEQQLVSESEDVVAFVDS